MSSGHDLCKGDYARQNLDKDEIWQKLDEELKLTFDQIFGKFAEIYWTLVTKYNIAQMPAGKKAAVVSVIRDLVLKNNISKLCLAR